jgi:hypothetical protein
VKQSRHVLVAPPIYAWMQQTTVEREKGFPEAYMVLPVF